MSQRTERVDELLRQEIGAIVAREVADPRVGFATITSVETTTDLRHAKVWVSVIGQPAERDAAVAALQHAMPFIRHELGKTLRLKRIPDLHVHLDDTAERGTRILQLLAEIETGLDPGPRCRPVAESLPTPVARLRARGPGRGAAVGGPPTRAGPTAPGGAADRPRADDAARAAARVAMTRRPHAVPRRRPAGRRRPAARRPARAGGQPREPGRRHARRHARRRPPRRGAGRRGRRRLHRPGPAALRLHRRRRAVPDRSGPGRAPTTCWSSRTADRSSGSARSAPATRSCSSGCRGSSSTTTPRTTRPARPTGSTRRRRHLRDGDARWPARLGRSMLDGRGCPGGGADGRHRDGHRDLRAPERHAAHARRLGGPRRGRRAAVRHLAPPLPDQARRPAAAVRGRARPARERGRRTDRLVEPDRRGHRRHRRRARPLGGDHRPALAGRGRRGRDPVQGGRATRRGSASGRSRAASTPRS